MVIYLVTNKIDGLMYVGQTIKTLEIRKEQHIYNAFNNSKYYFHRAIKKYGVDNFKWEILETVDDISQLNDQEIFYIKEFNTFEGDGYNLTEGGRGSLGWRHSDETKKKLSLLAINNGLGKYKTNKHKESISKSQIGKSYVERFGEEKAKEIIDERKKTYVERFGEEKAKEIIDKQRLNNKSSNQQVKSKMSDSHKKLLDKNGKRTNITDIGRQKMSDSKKSFKNNNYVSVSKEIINEIILTYQNNGGKVGKNMVDKFNLSVHVLRRVLKDNGIYGK